VNHRRANDGNRTGIARNHEPGSPVPSSRDSVATRSNRDVEGQSTPQGQQLPHRPGDKLGVGDGHEPAATHTPHRTSPVGTRPAAVRGRDDAIALPKGSGGAPKEGVRQERSRVVAMQARGP
jgi:hypothetical protein